MWNAEERTYLSKQGLILSKLRDRLEAQGVELAELPRDPGPGPLENVSGPLKLTINSEKYCQARGHLSTPVRFIKSEGQVP